MVGRVVLQNEIITLGVRELWHKAFFHASIKKNQGGDRT